MKLKFVLVIALIALFTFACKQKETTAATDTTANTPNTANQPPMASSATTLSDSDKEFINKAAEGGLAEVTLGQLAASKATSNDVKDFGNRMVNDHGKAGDELKALASQKGLTLPGTPSADEQKAQKDLSSKSGAAFDKAYMSNMVKDHEKDAKEFDKASKSVADPDLELTVAVIVS